MYEIIFRTVSCQKIIRQIQIIQAQQALKKEKSLLAAKDQFYRSLLNS